MRDKEEHMKERVIEIHRHAQRKLISFKNNGVFFILLEPEWKMKQFQNVDSKV